MWIKKENYVDQSFLLLYIDIKTLTKILASLIYQCIKPQFHYRSARVVKIFGNFQCLSNFNAGKDHLGLL